MSRISSLDDLKKKREEEDNKKENQFFAGGLDNRGGGSGLAVQAPPSGGGPGGRGGGGRGSNEHDMLHRIVERGAQDSRDYQPSSSQGAQTVEIALYRNGFTVNNGPFRDILAPENQRFLRSLQQGEVPDELAQNNNGPRELDVKLVNKIEEDYVPPSYVAFSGTAHSLGSTSSNEAFVFSTELLRGIPIPVLDESQPAVNIQLRTHDNKKIKLRVNANIVISSLAALILKETNSQSKSLRFTLSAGFPPKDVTDPTATVSEAGLAGAAVTMKAV